AGEGGTQAAGGGEGQGQGQGRRRHRRGRRGGRFRRRDREGREGGEGQQGSQSGGGESTGDMPENFQAQVAEEGHVGSDRSALDPNAGGEVAEGRRSTADRQSFKQQRSRDRRIPSKSSAPRGVRGQVNIQDLLKEGQEVLVQVAKDPIATK